MAKVAATQKIKFVYTFNTLYHISIETTQCQLPLIKMDAEFFRFVFDVCIKNWACTKTGFTENFPSMVEVSTIQSTLMLLRRHQ